MNRLKLAIIAGILILPSIAASQSKINLEQAYKLALEQSESFKLSAESIKLAEAQYEAALSAVFPQVNLSTTERSRNSGSKSNSGDSSGFSGSSSSRDDRFALSLGLTQPIFHGFRDIFLFQAADKEISARNLSSDRFKETLYQDVSEAFYQVILYRAQLAELVKTRETLQKRIEELAEFKKLGKSRDSELAAAQSELFQASASEEQGKGLLSASVELLSFFAGRQIAALDLIDSRDKSKLDDLDKYLEKAKDRLDIKASQALIDSSKLQVKAAERERWPGLDLTSNYYGYENPDQGRDWDLLLNLSMPIFDGGKISAHVAEQRSALRSRELERQQLLRETERDVRVAFNDLVSSQNEAKALSKAALAAQANYEAQKRDYALGVVNNLEVLESIKQLYDLRRQLIGAQAREQVNRVKLMVAAGGIQS